MVWRTCWLVFAITNLGCFGEAKITGPQTGSIPPGDLADFVKPSGDPTAPDACIGMPMPAGTGGLRRLTVPEQRNSYRDLLNDQTLNPALESANAPLITEIEVEALNLAAAALVKTGKHLTHLPCTASGAFNATCVDSFISRFGRMVFRRPVRDEERQWLMTEVYDVIRTHTGFSPPATFREAVDAVAQAMLQSPQFIYALKEGVSDPALPPGVRRLTGYERAENLSYFFWRSTPDATLLDAAGSGALDTPEGVRAQAERLLNTPRAKGVIRDFAATWLELNGNDHQQSLELTPKSATAFPFDSPALRTAMREEVSALYEDVFFNQGASFATLMTSRRAYVNRSLAQMYGFSSLPASDTTYEWREHDASQRAGLFTRAAFLTAYAPQEEKSAIRRGVFMLRHALCQELGPPPPDVNNVQVPTADHAMTARESIEVRTASATCQGCHSRINPLGFVFENYDAMGRFHTTEKVTYQSQSYTLPVNSTATLIGTDFNSTLNGATELSTKLAQSGFAKDCMAFTWFQSVAPKSLTSADACGLQRVMRRFRASDDMRDLSLSLVTEEAALFIRETP
jgi:hypothetical protein